MVMYRYSILSCDVQVYYFILWCTGISFYLVMYKYIILSCDVQVYHFILLLLLHIKETWQDY